MLSPQAQATTERERQVIGRISAVIGVAVSMVALWMLVELMVLLF